MKLYCFPPSPNTRKALTVAYHLDIDVEIEYLNLVAGDQRKPEYLKLNPNGFAPTLVDGDFKLWESNAIMQYLASKKPNDLWPADERTRADITRWQFWELAHFGSACATVLYENIVKKFFNLGDPDPSVVKQGEERFHRFAGVLDDHLQTRDYLVGRGMTLADISAGSYLMYAKECPLPLEPYRAIQRWFAQLDELPAWRKAAPQPIN